MSTRTTIIIFGVLFAIGVTAIVILPFVLGGGPEEPDEVTPGEAVRRGVFRSDDGGRTWEAKVFIEGSADSIAGFQVNRLIQDPVDPATLYLLTDGNGLWVSRSRGDLWAPVNDQSGVLDLQSNVLAMAVNPAKRTEWFVAVYQAKRGRVLATDDDGRTFREIYFTPVERFGVFDIHYDAGRGAVIIATGQGGLLESTDRGRAWRVVRFFADGLVRLVISPASPSLWFAVGSGGNLYRSEDRGVSWADVSDGFEEFSGAESDQSWVSDARGVLYLGSRHGLLASADRGETFTRLPLIVPPDALPILAVAPDPRSPSHLAVSAQNQIYATEDGGERWMILTAPGEGRITRLLIDAERANTLYAVVQP